MKVEKNRSKYILALRGVQHGAVTNKALATQAISDERTVVG
jgi:hypothetical protein